MKTLLHTLSLTLLLVATSCDEAESKDSDKENKDTQEDTQAPEVSYDLSKDDDIVEMMKIEWKADQLEKDDICIERPSAFDELIVVGSFAHDRGCAGNDVIYKGKLSNTDAVTSKVLNDNGWSDRKNRGQLAVSYTTDVLHVWESVLSGEADAFESEEYVYADPSFSMEDGEVTVTCWIKEPSGMQPINSFYHLTIVYSNDGTIQSYEKTNQFSQDI